MTMVTLPKVGDEETFINTDFLIGTQIYTGSSGDRLLIYMNGMSHSTLMASDEIPIEALRALNDKLITAINGPAAGPHREARHDG